MAAGHLVEPRHDCALYWAQLLTQSGNLRGTNIEKYVLDTMERQIYSARANKDYDSAIDDVNRLTQFYPGSGELAALKSQIEREQQHQTTEAQLKRYILQHRHLIFADNGQMVQAYCVGVLLLASDGTARFDCTMTFDPQGRCDHVIFQTSMVKEVKFLKNGLLHVATNHMGNFDFYGEPTDLEGAYAGLGSLARR